LIVIIKKSRNALKEESFLLFVLEKKMVEKKVRALTDFNFKNELGFWMMTEGDVTTISFKSEKDLAEHLVSGRFELVGEEIKEGKNIQVLYKKNSSIPSENELLSTLEHTGHLDKLDPTPHIEPPVRRKNPWVVT
jgi:hypothetical protein